MIPVEIELKWALSAAEHAALAGHLAALLGPPLRLAQENRFCDSADGRLRAARMSVRLRRENGRVVLTCKRKGAVDALGTHRHDEWERELPPVAWDADPASLPLHADWLAALAGTALVGLGGFANLRLEWRDGAHLLCLDTSDFGPRTDHELEIETPQPEAAAARWSALLAQWGIGVRPQPLTKLQRWYELNAGGRGGRPPGR